MRALRPCCERRRRLRGLVGPLDDVCRIEAVIIAKLVPLDKDEVTHLGRPSADEVFVRPGVSCKGLVAHGARTQSGQPTSCSVRSFKPWAFLSIDWM